MRQRLDKMKKLGALIIIVDKANSGTDSSPVDVEDLLAEFDGFVVVMGNGGNKADDLDPHFDGNEEQEVDANFRIEISHTITPEIRANIEKFQANIDDAEKEIKPIEIVRKEVTRRLK